MRQPFSCDVAVVGGCGHVGLPLALAFAERGQRVRVYDVDDVAVERVNAGMMPFEEAGATEVLTSVAGAGLVASTDPRVISEAEHVVFVIGTPVEDNLDPDPQSVADAVAGLAEHLRTGQLLVLRSTLFPGATARVEAALAAFHHNDFVLGPPDLAIPRQGRAVHGPLRPRARHLRARSGALRGGPAGDRGPTPLPPRPGHRLAHSRHMGPDPSGGDGLRTAGAGRP